MSTRKTEVILKKKITRLNCDVMDSKGNVTDGYSVGRFKFDGHLPARSALAKANKMFKEKYPELYKQGHTLYLAAIDHYNTTYKMSTEMFESLCLDNGEVVDENVQ